ncbi:uncharacterized protein [Diadema antillarum]|uniref:uncharacterized protein n=1 Tax=Diadema antillarum TaxID=105358 RepID=UPI003A852980
MRLAEEGISILKRGVRNLWFLGLLTHPALHVEGAAEFGATRLWVCSCPPPAPGKPGPLLNSIGTVIEGNSFKIEKSVKPEELYTLKEELGKGKFGVVYRCEEKATGKIWAAKYVKTIRAKDREDVLREITLMSELEHPSLMALVAAFQTTRQTVLILECITGGELFERIVDDKFDLTESEVISYMRQICAGVQHMHHHHVLHLDLKPENIMCVNRTGFQLKIIDFGLARKYEPGGEIKVLCGTPEFVAPEVVSFEPIAHPTDMWSVGVICYILLSGLSPFMGDNDNDTLNNVTMGDWDFDDEVFDNISCQAKDFISSLLIKDMSKRMTVDECFRHPWLSEISTRTRACENKLSTERHKKFLARRRWQKTANAVRAIGRMNALRLVSQRKANKSNGSSSSEKSPTSPSPTPSPQETKPKSPEPKPTGGVPAETGKRKPAPEAETKKEKVKIDTNIDQGTDGTNAAPCVSPPPLNNRDSSSLPTESNGREFSCTLDSDIENDSGLDLSLDHNALGKRSTSVSERSSQDSVVAGKDDLLIDEEVRTPDEGPNGDATRVDKLLSREKGAEPILDAQPAACVNNGKSDSGVCSDASEDTVSSDPGVNMERYLFDPSKGVKNQAAKWEVRTQSPDRAAKLKSKAAQPPPQQAPVFRQKFRHCEVALGSEARFECRVDGHPSPDIIWYKNGKRVMEGERYSIKRGVEDIHCLVVKEVARDDQGTFMCEARSPAGKARCSARLVIQHPSLSRDDIKSPSPESKEPKTNGTSRKFWHFGSSKNKDQRDKSATPVKSPTSPPVTTNSKQSLFGLSFDRKTSFRGATDDRSPASPAASPGQTTAQKSAVDKLKERAEAFTQEYEKRKGERQSLADREPRRASISLYLDRYSRSASADRSSSFSISSSSGRRSSTASSTDESDFEPRPRPRLATYATMIRSTQSIGSLAAKFEQNKANGSPAKSVTSPSPRKDLKYNANLDAKKALFSNAANGSTSASSTKSKAKDPVPLISRSSVLQTPSTSSLRSKFESPSKEKETAAAPFTRSTQVRQSTGKFSYLDKIDSKEKEVSPSTSSFSRASPTLRAA